MFISEQQMLLQIFFLHDFTFQTYTNWCQINVFLSFGVQKQYWKSNHLFKAQIPHIKKCFWQETRVWLHLPVVAQSSANNDRLG